MMKKDLFKVGEKAFYIGNSFTDLISIKVGIIKELKEDNILFDDYPIWYPKSQIVFKEEDVIRLIKEKLSNLTLNIRK